MSVHKIAVRFIKFCWSFKNYLCFLFYIYYFYLDHRHCGRLAGRQMDELTGGRCCERANGRSHRHHRLRRPMAASPWVRLVLTTCTWCWRSGRPRSGRSRPTRPTTSDSWKRTGARRSYVPTARPSCRTWTWASRRLCSTPTAPPVTSVATAGTTAGIRPI